MSELPLTNGCIAGSRQYTIAVGNSCFLEYLVVWPFPTASLAAAQAYRPVRDDPGVVLNVPATRNEVNLQAMLGQTLHAQPMIGGRLLRDIPGSTAVQDFLNAMVLQPEAADIVPVLPDVERLALLSAYDVGWVAYHAIGDDAAGSARAPLAALLGPPASGVAGQALFRVPEAAAASDEIVVLIGENWDAPEVWGDARARWFHDVGVLRVYSPTERAARLTMTLIPELDLHVIAVKVNGAQVAEFAPGDWLPFETPTFNLQAGVNELQLVDLRGSRSVVGDLRCSGGAPLSGPFDVALDCDPTLTGARQLSAGVQNLSVESADGEAEASEVLATFEDNVHLLRAEFSERARVGETARITLYWTAGRTVETDWTSFIHIAEPDGAPVASRDGQPMEGRAPTTSWTPGQIVAYSVYVPIPMDATPGTYQVRTGWYQWPALERFRAESSSFAVADQALILGEIRIER